MWQATANSMGIVCDVGSRSWHVAGQRSMSRYATRGQAANCPRFGPKLASPLEKHAVLKWWFFRPASPRHSASGVTRQQACKDAVHVLFAALG